MKMKDRKDNDGEFSVTGYVVPVQPSLAYIKGLAGEYGA